MLKKVNRRTGVEEILASTNASNILLDDPLVVEKPTVLSEVIHQQNITISELKSNVKWLYKYGGTGSGGGGGGGGGGTNSYFELISPNSMEVGGDRVVYISDTKVVLKYKIFQRVGSSKYRHTITMDGTVLKSDEPLSSNVDATLTLLSLSSTDTNTLIFTATDEEGYQLDRFVVKIISGSISLSSPTVNNGGSISKYIGTGDISVLFNIMNRIKGATTTLEIKQNNIEQGKVLKTFTQDGAISYTLEIMKELFGGQPLETGVSYTISAIAYTTLSGQSPIPSDLYLFTVSLMDSKSLIVSYVGLSELSLPDDSLNMATFKQGSEINFTYSFNAASYNSFYVAFKILDKQKNLIASVGTVCLPGQQFDEETGEDLFYKNKLVQKGVQNPFSYSTNKIPPDKLGLTYIEIYGWTTKAEMGSGVGGEMLPIKSGKCKIELVNQVVPNYTGGENTLHINLDVPQDYSDMQDQDSYLLKANVYDDKGIIVPYSTRMLVYDSNHITNGFIKNRLSQNNAALRLAGGTYAKIPVDFFAAGSGMGSWALLGSGFTISVTYRCDMHPDSNGTIFSYGTYNALGELILGFEINLESVNVKFNDKAILKNLTAETVQNVLTTIDIVCEKNPSENLGFVKIYADGVLTAVTTIENIDNLDFGTLRDGVFLGCRNKGQGNFDNFCDVNIHNVRIYKKSLPIPDLINNYIINYSYLHKLADGDFDWMSITNLMASNFVQNTPEGWQCTLWDYFAEPPSWKKGNELFAKIDATPVFPVVLLQETVASKDFHELYNGSYNESNAPSKQTPTGCTMTYNDPVSGNKIQINDMMVSLQGTTSMGYSTKNLEIYFGLNPDGTTNRLFTPKESWLPENRFTLKADVIDSAHANNVSIGTFINKYFTKIYPQMFGANPYAAKVKHTLEGFPIYCFFKFGDSNEPTFLGVYNFNLGRGSNYNLGFEILKSYTLLNTTAPSVIDTYSVIPDPYKGGIFSFEFNTNQPTDVVAFQQQDESIVRKILDLRYSAGTQYETKGWNRMFKIFDTFARMYVTANAPKKWIFQNNNYVETSDTVGTKINYNPEFFPRGFAPEDNQGLIYWENANKYFVAAMAFGLVDSLGKNMTIRSWTVEDNDHGLFFTTFYDMDTAFGLDNVGTVMANSETLYIDYWYNTIVDGYTVAKKMENAAPSGVNGYDMPCSRLWEIVRSIPVLTDAVFQNNYQSYYMAERAVGGEFETAEKFVTNYFLSHSKDIGASIYNMDYATKYLKKYDMELDNGEIVSGYNDVKFLHGTRKNFVLHWFGRRLKYIDGCMNITGHYTQDNENNRYNMSMPPDRFKDSPYVMLFNSRCNGSISQDGLFAFQITTNTPAIFTFTVGTITQRVVLPANKEIEFKSKSTNSSSSAISFNCTTSISRFKGFEQLNFKSIGSFPLYNLLDLDLSGMKSFDDGRAEYFNIKGLTELRNLNLQGLSAEGNSGFTVDVSLAYKLKTINIQGSKVSSLQLPVADSADAVSGGVLTDLKIANSQINNLTVENQQFIETLDFSGCISLQKVNLRSMRNLKTVIFSGNSSLASIEISDCESLVNVTAKNLNRLSEFKVLGICNALQIIDIGNCADPSLMININGASNLLKLNLSGTRSTVNPIFPAKNVSFYKTLTCLNLHDTSFKGIDFGSIGETSKYKGEVILDLSNFTNLGQWTYNSQFTSCNGLSMTMMNNVVYIKFNNSKTKPFKIVHSQQITNGTLTTLGFFNGCNQLLRVFGHIDLAYVAIFTGCPKFFIREPLDKVNGVTPFVAPTWSGGDCDMEAQKTEWNDNKNLDTNIAVMTYTNMTDVFRETAVSLSDLYYILQLYQNITYSPNTFLGCSNIICNVTDSLNRNTFSKCGKVTNFTSLFQSCGNLGGILYSPSHTNNGANTTPTITCGANYDGLLSPLASISGFGLNNMFWGTPRKYADDMLFWCRNSSQAILGITSLSGFDWSSGFYSCDNTTVNPGVTPTMTNGWLASRILRYLPNLTSMSYTFRNCKIFFDLASVIDPDNNNATVYYNQFLFYNPALVEMQYCFQGMVASGSWDNIFGGDDILRSKFPNNFPRGLVLLMQSLYVDGNNSGTHPGNSGKLQYPIKNTMFNRIANSIQRISGNITNSSERASMYAGTDVMEKIYDPKHFSNQNQQFPYDIFINCINLIEIPYFFYGMKYSAGTSYGEPTSIPNHPDFETALYKCTKLSNVAYTYSNLQFPVKLNGFAFSKCNIINANSAFTCGSQMTGSIPYGVFYSEKLGLTKSAKGWKDGDKIGGILVNLTYGWDANGNYNPDIPVPAALTTQISYNVINRTILNMDRTFSSYTGTRLQPYKFDCPTSAEMKTISDLGNLLIHNEDYNPVRWILNTRFNADREPEQIPNPKWDGIDPSIPKTIPNPIYDKRMILENPSYNKFQKIWNEHIVCGEQIANEIANSRAYLDNKGTSFPVVLPDCYSDPADVRMCSDVNIHEKLKNKQYFCSPDVFCYLSDVANVSLNHCFAFTSRRGSGSDDSAYGLYGRIPPMIFKKLTRATSLIGVFRGFLYNGPHFWNYSVNGNEMKGQAYPEELLYSFSANLKNISQLFATTTINKYCEIPMNMLTKQSQINDVSHLFGIAAQWQGDDSFAQLPSSFFQSNRLLQNVCDLIGNASVSADVNGIVDDSSSISSSTWSFGPAKFDGSVLNSMHSAINNFSYFMVRCAYTSGTVPDFNWTKVQGDNYRRAWWDINFGGSRISNAGALMSGNYKSAYNQIT